MPAVRRPGGLAVKGAHFEGSWSRNAGPAADDTGEAVIGGSGSEAELLMRGCDAAGGEDGLGGAASTSAFMDTRRPSGRAARPRGVPRRPPARPRRPRRILAYERCADDRACWGWVTSGLRRDGQRRRRPPGVNTRPRGSSRRDVGVLARLRAEALARIPFHRSNNSAAPYASTPWRRPCGATLMPQMGSVTLGDSSGHVMLLFLIASEPPPPDRWLE